VLYQGSHAFCNFFGWVAVFYGEEFKFSRGFGGFDFYLVDVRWWFFDLECFDEFFNGFSWCFCDYFDCSVWHVLHVAFNSEFPSDVLNCVAVADSLNFAIDYCFDSGGFGVAFFLHCCLPSIVF